MGLLIPALGRQRQEDHEFKGNMVRPSSRASIRLHCLSEVIGHMALGNRHPFCPSSGGQEQADLLCLETVQKDILYLASFSFSKLLA